VFETSVLIESIAFWVSWLTSNVSVLQIADNVFHLEKIAIESGIATPHQYEEAVLLVDDFKDLMHEIDEEVGMVHDVSFMDGHIEKIKSYVK
jgi:hypothetical protein